jgi:hypothetical protein
MRRRRVATVAAVVVALLGVAVAVLAMVGDGATTAGTNAAPAVAPGSGTVGSDDASGSGRRASGPGVPEAATVPGAATDDAPTVPLPDAVGRDVLRTAQLTLEVPDPTAATRGVRTAVAAAGGFVAEEQSDGTGSWLVVRVPAAALDRLVDDLAATGTVLGRSARAEDATEQVVDLDSRVGSQQASVTRLRALLAQATSIGDIVTVESELARREADLESLQRRLAALRDRVALSTLTVELRGAVAGPPSAPPPGFGAGLSAGWAGLKVVGAALATAIGFALPFLPVLAAAAAVVWVVMRRRRARPKRGGPGREGGV